mmetsp:Transcript_89931/g.143092  ORF Transcript_89931/g.143092 Transcript_89931/m.143092 type:complete len:99 (-) Transcript_89931:962-1258(-)
MFIQTIPIQKHGSEATHSKVMAFQDCSCCGTFRLTGGISELQSSGSDLLSNSGETPLTRTTVIQLMRQNTAVNTHVAAMARAVAFPNQTPSKGDGQCQ